MFIKKIEQLQKLSLHKKIPNTNLINKFYEI